MKIVKAIFGVLFSLVVAFVLIGLFAPSEYTGKVTEIYPNRADVVWQTLTDFESLAARRPEIKEVEILGDNGSGHFSWREHTKMGGYVEFEIVDSVPLHLLEVHLLKGSFAMEGTWTYLMEGLPNGSTKLTISETSKVHSFVMRTLMYFAGRDKYIKQEHQYLKNSLVGL